MAEIIGKSIKKLTSVDSTNNYASQQLIQNGCCEGAVFIAEEQFCGRGQIRNTWESESGKNILMSIVLFPTFLPVRQQFMLSKVVALGIFDIVSLYVNNLSVKWPNDVYIGNNKVAGILIENSIMGSVIDTSIVGIGLNVNQIEFVSDAPNPISIAKALGVEIDKNILLSELIESIDRWYLRLKNHENELIDLAYLSVLYRVGVLANYKDVNGEYRGIVRGVNSIGQLIIERETGKTSVYHFKEVEFL